MKGKGSWHLVTVVILAVVVVCFVEGRIAAVTDRSSLFLPRSLSYAQRPKAFIFRNFTKPYIDFIDKILLDLQGSSNVTEQCRNDCQLLLKLVGQDNKYALKRNCATSSKNPTFTSTVIDATGKLSSGILEGGVSFPGFFSECLSITPVKSDSLHNGFPFSGKYCSVTVQLSAASMHEDIPEVVWDVLTKSPKPIFIGLCVPSSCSTEDVSRSSNAVASGTFNGSSSSVGSCHVINEDKFAADTPAIIFLCFLGIYISVTVAATCCDLFCPFIETPPEKKVDPVSLHKANSSYSTCEGGVQPDNTLPNRENTLPMNPQEFIGSHSLESQLEAERKGIFILPASTTNGSQEPLCAREQGASRCLILLRKCFLAFSLLKSARCIASTRKSSVGIITSFDGIRLFSMMLIIAGHTYSFGMLNLFIRNPAAANDAPKNGIIFHAFSNGTLTVDSFYFLSGTLTAFLTLKILARSNGKLNILQFYLHRFVRLTPIVMIVIGICALLLRHVGDGPNWISAVTMFDVWCEKNWWINFIYLQNFIDTENMCLSHSWYLATDMQFALVTPFILLALNRKFVYGAVTLVCLFIATVITTFVITWVNDYPAIPYLTPIVDQDKMNLYYKNVYIKPYCRIGPYLIGLALGYFLLKHKELKLPKAYVIAGWCVSVLVALIVVFGMWPATEGHLPSTTSSAFYSSLARSVWAVFLAWLVVACFYGYGGFVNSILSWPPLEPFSKLTYCAYLIHPVVMNIYYGMMETTVQFSNNFMLYMVVGNVVLTYMISFVLSILFEVPLITLEKVLTGKKH